MSKPNITWYVKNFNDEYVSNDAYYAGSYVDKPIVIPLRIWNNRYGTEDVDTVSTLKLNLYFDCIEDNALLPYISVSTASIGGTTSIVNNVLTVTFMNAVSISGKKNDGTEKNGYDNYVDITIAFQPPDTVRLKSHDLKNLFIEIAE